MKTLFRLLGCGLPVLFAACGPKDADAYLKEVIARLEKIESAGYQLKTTVWSPYEDKPLSERTWMYHEYANPADTAIGACFVSFSEGMRFEGAYDGRAKLNVYHDKKGVLEDDFATNRLPFRVTNTPFFHSAKAILQYTLETTDSIRTSLVDEDSCYHFSLTVYEDTQVEIFGRMRHMPKPPAEFATDPESHYELWIRKSDGLPFKMYRKMSHEINMEECLRPEFNRLSLADLNIYDYIPADYEFRTTEQNNRIRQQAKDRKPALQDMPAPAWTLTDTEDRPVSLKDIKSKVILLNFTGIGCGACQAAVPFLKELKSKYPNPDDFALIAIESWSNRTSSRSAYATKKELNYPMLGADEQVLDDYQTGRSAPWFFLLDERRFIRKVISGYSYGRTDKEIEEAIKAML